jgi:hypothetical protein
MIHTFQSLFNRRGPAFFGGWDYGKNLINDPEYLKIAYLNGVPMGGDLPEKPATSKAPTFIVQAI